MGGMSESDLLGYILARCRTLDLLVFHSTDPVRDIGPGFPDLVIAGPRGVIFAELKSGQGVMSADQRAWRRALSYALNRPGSASQYELWSPTEWESGQIERQIIDLARALPIT
jgi:hypothetical protein